MKKLWRIILVLVIIAGGSYMIERYETHKFSEALGQMDLVNFSQISKVTVAIYPAMDAYTSYDQDEINDLYNMLSKIEMKEKRNFEESEYYYKIKFSDDSQMQSIVYTFSNNDYVKLEEVSNSMYRTAYFQLKDSVYQSVFDQFIYRD